MLKGISPIISPELLKNHRRDGGTATSSFWPTRTSPHVHRPKCVRCDGHGCAEVMQALLTLFPLDDFVEAPLARHAGAGGHVPQRQSADLGGVPRGGGYRSAHRQIRYDGARRVHGAREKAFAVVQTGETALYSNIIIRKGRCARVSALFSLTNKRL